MHELQTVLTQDSITGRGRSVNPFIVIDDAAGFIDFAQFVFDGTEETAVRTATPNGSLIHAEVRIGDSLILLSDRQEGWSAHPGYFEIWVSNAELVIARAIERGSTLVTPATPFYGELTLARVEDPWQNLWWLYSPAPGQPDPRPAWDGGSDTVFRTLDEHLRHSSGPL